MIESRPSGPDPGTAPRALPLAAFLAFIALLNFPNLNFDLHNLFYIDGWGPDPSMFVALHMAVRDGLQFGRDVIFTYGPLGYLTFTVYVDDTTWLHSVAYQLTAHALLFTSLFCLLRRIAADAWAILAVGFVASVFLQAIGGWLIDLKLLLALLVLGFLRLTGPRGAYWRDALLGVLAAVPLYIKFSGGVTALLIHLTFVCLAAWRGDYRRAGAALLGYLATAFGLGFALLGSVAGMAAFFESSFEIAATYVDAVAIEGPGWQVSLGLIAGAVYLRLLDRARREGNRNGLTFLLLAAGLCLAGFKHGFVRHDAHVAGFFAIWMTVGTLFWIIAARDLRTPTGKLAGGFAAALSTLTFAMVFLNSSDFFFHRIFTSMIVDARNIPRFVEFVTRERPALQAATATERRAQIEQALAWVPDSNLAKATRDRIGKDSVDILPWDIAIAERYGWNWNPRPMFQSYSAFSDRIDAGNAAHFSGGDAPRFALLGHRSVDGRCPTFDEPETFRTLLTHYRPVGRDGAFLLLERDDSASAPRERELGAIAATWGESIRVPASDRGYVFARVSIDYSALGRVARLVYKPPPVYIRLESRGMGLKYRLVPSTAKNGLFVSRYILGARDLLDVWSGNLRQMIDAIAITTDDPAFYSPRVSVEFFEIPFPVRVQRDWKVACDEGGTILPGGQHSIGVVKGDHIANWTQPIPHDRAEPLVISGWAIDEAGEDLAGDVFVRVDGQLVAPADYERIREDVAAHFENDAYTYSGWSANLDLEEFAPGTHKINLRIISRDGQRCYEPSRGFRVYLHD